MKKTYIIPESVTVVLNSLHIIAQSPLGAHDDDEVGDDFDWDSTLTKESESAWDNEW